MFTGIVEEIGKIKSVKSGVNSAQLCINANVVLDDLKIGDSVAVNGVCLTATKINANEFWADVMHETLNRSNLKNLNAGDNVNLERAMPANGRFGGHNVSGHIDCTEKIIDIKKDDRAIWYTCSANSSISKYIVEKGSITIDGISLTVAKISDKSFSISAIPHTIENTILKDKKRGDIVNIETDIYGKYVEKLIASHKNTKPKSKITHDFLSSNGF